MDSAAIPTVGDAVEALNDICSDLADTLKQIGDLSAELSSKDHIEVDNIQEASRVADVKRVLTNRWTDCQHPGCSFLAKPEYRPETVTHMP